MQSTSAKTLVDVQSGLKFAKCPRWIRQKLLFLDIHDRCIKSADMKGTIQTVGALHYLPGSFEVLGRRIDSRRCLASKIILMGNSWPKADG